MPSDCEDCGERPATECFENGAELCGPCAVERFKGQLSDAGRAAIAAQPVGQWEEAPRYVWICLCGIRWNSSVADCSKCRSVRPETAAAPTEAHEPEGAGLDPAQPVRLEARGT